MSRIILAGGRSVALRFLAGYLITLGLIFGTQWTYYEYFDRYVLPTVAQPIEILNEDNEIAIGDVILMKLIIDKPEDILAIESSNDITCEGGNLVTMAGGGTVSVGQFELISDNYLLPNKVGIGDVCQFNFRNRYQPNRQMQSELITWSSEKFTVVER